MIFTTCPVVIEIYDDANDVAAKVEAAALQSGDSSGGVK